MLLTGLNFLVAISIMKVNGRKGCSQANRGFKDVHIALLNFTRVGGITAELRSGDLGQRDSPS